jgi:predicted nucleic acid-binding protein
MAKTDQAAGEVVCDAGPLIHLDELGCLDLLADFSAVLVPDTVWQEVTRHRPDALRRPVPQLTRVQLSFPDEASLKTLIQVLSLDAGEQAALALMLQHPEAILLTDDAAARLAANQLGMRVHGTLGVLLRAIRRGQRTAEEVLTLLRSLPQQSTLHVRPDLLNAIIDQVRQEFGVS